MLRYLRKGDQLIVTSMDRLARSFLDMHTMVDDLVHRGVSVRFLRESQTYSSQSDPVAALMLGVLGSVAQFERAIFTLGLTLLNDGALKFGHSCCSIEPPARSSKA